MATLDSFVPNINALGDSAVVVRLGDSMNRAVFERVRAFSRCLNEHRFPGWIEQVPAYATVTVHYDPRQISWADVRAWIEPMLHRLGEASEPPPRTVEIPVCYGGEFGEDLAFVAEHADLTPDEVIEIHSGAEYLVYMLGFAPGFPYLGGMPERITAPRRDSPRLKIPAGSVGIAGSQTGVYPIETPGGWRLIGRTPLALFRPWQDPPALLRSGDLVRFRPIDEPEYHALREVTR